MPKTDLMSTAEAATILGCHVRTVHRMVAAGELVPAMKFPGKRGALMFRASDVARLVKRRAA